MGFSYRAARAKKSGLNVSASKNGLNISYTLDIGLAKINIPIMGRRKKTRVTAKGSGLFSMFF
jgi:hypothetical protein